MSDWSFVLRLNQALTPAQADAFDHCDAFADGSVSYTLGPEGPHAYSVPADPAKLSELSCDIEAPSLLDAVAQVAQDVRFIPGLHAIGVRFDDTVTLAEAAQRCDRSHQSLVELSRDRHGPAGFPDPESDTEGTVFYSWHKVADFSRRLGDVVPETTRELDVADRALRLAHALEGLEVTPGTLRALGLPTA